MILGAMIGIAYNKIGEDVARALLKEPEMTNVLEELVEQGYEQGLAEGDLKGKVEGKRESVRMLILVRFGAVPAVLEEQIAAADAAALDALFSRAAVARHVEEVE